MNKIYKKLLIIDASYMMHRQLHVKNLWELRNSSQRTGGIFGFLRSLNRAIENAPIGYYPVCVWDSGLSSRRVNVFSNYKHSEDREYEDKITQMANSLIDEGVVKESDELGDNYLQELKDKIHEIFEYRKNPQAAQDEDYLYQYRSQRDQLIDILTDLGVKSIKYPGTEGDDLQYLLSKLSEKSIIVTDDSDLQQLVTPDTSIMKVLKGTSFITWKTITEEWNLRDAHHLARVKAIVGDSSDNVPQLVKGLGEVTANQIVDVMNEYDQDPSKYIPALKVKFANKSKIQEFIEVHDDYLRNLQLVDLSLVEEDQSIVNYLITELSTPIRANYLGAVRKLGNLDISNVPIDQIIQNSISSYSILLIKE